MHRLFLVGRSSAPRRVRFISLCTSDQRISTSLVVCNIAASSSSSCPRKRARCSCNQPAGSLRNQSALPASPASEVEIQRSRRPGIRVAISLNEFRAFKQWNRARYVFEGAFHLIQVSVMISHQVKSRCELNSSFSSEVNSFVRNFFAAGPASDPFCISFKYSQH